MELELERVDCVIPIKNVYYMLSYAYHVLREDGYKQIETEEFDHIGDLLSAILVKGVSIQLKRGLVREYQCKQEPLSSLQGKIELTQSLKSGVRMKKQLVCEYDEYSLNSPMNRILKCTMQLLVRADLPKHRKKELRKLLLFFADVEEIPMNQINWRFSYHQNNQSYQMLLGICYLIIKGLLQTTSQGTSKLMHFLDEQQMHRLYEKFILEYYRKEHPYLDARASQIPWQLDDGMSDFLPIMQSDIMLTQGNRTLIIDAKYYGKVMRSYYETSTIHSANLYQIFTYVKNKKAEVKEEDHIVSGMLLYARTNESLIPNQTYQMSGNSIHVTTLDLNCEFTKISKQLNQIIDVIFDSKS